MDENSTVALVSPAEHPGNTVYANYRATVSKGLGITQIILGIIVALCSGCASRWDVVGTALPGTLLGVLFIITGAFAVSADRKRTQCYIVATLVLTILSSCIGFYMFSSSVAWAALVAFDNNQDYDNQDYRDYDIFYLRIRRILPFIIGGACFLMVIISIVLSGFGCGAICCRCCCGGTKPVDVERPAAGPPPYTLTIADQEKKVPL